MESPTLVETKSSPTQITTLPADVFRGIANLLTDKEVGNLQVSKSMNNLVTVVQSYNAYWKSRSSKSLKFEFLPEDQLLPNLTWKAFYRKLPKQQVVAFLIIQLARHIPRIKCSIYKPFAEFFTSSVFCRWLETYPEASTSDGDSILEAIVEFNRDDLCKPVLRLLELNLDVDVDYPLRFSQHLLATALHSNEVWKILTQLIPRMTQLNDESSIEPDYSALGFVIESLNSTDIAHFILACTIYSKIVNPGEVLEQVIYSGTPDHLAYLCKKYPQLLDTLVETLLEMEESMGEQIASFVTPFLG